MCGPRHDRFAITSNSITDESLSAQHEAARLCILTLPTADVLRLPDMALVCLTRNLSFILHRVLML